MQVWGREFLNPWRCSCVRHLTVDTSRLTFPRSWLVRSSAGSTTHTAGKGWQRERPTAETTACPDHLAARMADDRGASGAPRDSRARRTGRHAAPDAAPDPPRGYARTESVQFLSLPGMVRRDRKK